MADNSAVPGPSAPKKTKWTPRKCYTEDELLKIIENENYDDLDLDYLPESDDGWESSDSEVRDQDESAQVENDVPSEDDDNVAVQTTNDVTNKQVIDWKTESVDMKYFPFTKTESLLIRPNDNTPMGYFRLLLTDEFLQEVVHHTNYNAVQIFLSESTKEQSRIGAWKDLSVEEFLVFLGVFLHMGNVRMKRLQDYWKRDPLFHCKAIASSMSRNRFLVVLRSLHFAENPNSATPPPEDSL